MDSQETAVPDLRLRYKPGYPVAAVVACAMIAGTIVGLMLLHMLFADFMDRGSLMGSWIFVIVMMAGAAAGGGISFLVAKKLDTMLAKMLARGVPPYMYEGCDQTASLAKPASEPSDAITRPDDGLTERQP